MNVMSTQKHVTPADFGATREISPRFWSWWERDQILLSFYDDERDPRPYTIRFFDETQIEGMTLTQLEKLHAIIGKALECQQAMLQQKQEARKKEKQNANS